MYIYIHIYIYIYIYIYICMYVCIYVYCRNTTCPPGHRHNNFMATWA